MLDRLGAHAFLSKVLGQFGETLKSIRRAMRAYSASTSASMISTPASLATRILRFSSRSSSITRSRE